MTQADEKELVLGNKQLISLFFVVAALCGVFFAMGYMIGRNSTKASVAAASDSMSSGASAAVPRQQPEPPRETAAAQPDAISPVMDQPAPAEQSQQVQTRPAQDSAAVAAAPPKESAKPSAVAVTTPETGAQYLQITALPRADADNMVRTLREQSFPAIVAESSKEGLFRVLVGPYHQTAQTADAKNRLKTLGFANAFVQRQ